MTEEEVNKYYKDNAQKQRIEAFVKHLDNKKIGLEKLSIEYASKFLNKDDLILFYKISIDLFYEEYRNLKKENNKLKKQLNETKFEFICTEVTPYTILGLEEKEYSKEELLTALQKKINHLQQTIPHREELEMKIDEALDAYGDIIQNSQGQK